VGGRQRAGAVAGEPVRVWQCGGVVVSWCRAVWWGVCGVGGR